MTGRGWWVDTLLLLALILWTVARAQDPHLDLPVHPPVAPVPSTALTAPDRFRLPAGVVPLPPHDDPRDETPPVFFGEEIETEGGGLVYVLDVSGSMRREERLQRAQRETVRSILGLPPSVRFNVVAYSCSLSRLWPSSRAATDSAQGEACKWVMALQASGGTGTGPAVALALSDRGAGAVALLTDGAPNCGAPEAAGHRRMIRDANAQRAPVNVFGVDASGDYRRFCQLVAADSGGDYTDVP